VEFAGCPPWLTFLKLTCLLLGINSSTSERERARANRIEDIIKTETEPEFRTRAFRSQNTENSDTASACALSRPKTSAKMLHVSFSPAKMLPAKTAPRIQWLKHLPCLLLTVQDTLGCVLAVSPLPRTRLLGQQPIISRDFVSASSDFAWFGVQFGTVLDSRTTAS